MPATPVRTRVSDALLTTLRSGLRTSAGSNFTSTVVAGAVDPKVLHRKLPLVSFIVGGIIVETQTINRRRRDLRIPVDVIGFVRSTNAGDDRDKLEWDVFRCVARTPRLGLTDAMMTLVDGQEIEYEEAERDGNQSSLVALQFAVQYEVRIPEVVDLS